MKSEYARPAVTIGMVLLALVLVRALNLGIPLSVTTSAVSSELSVVGEGKVDVTPDTAYVDVGVTVENVATAEEAQKRLSDANNKITTAMKAQGIPEADIKTSNYSVFPNYVYEGSRNRVTGYNGNATITVKTVKIETAGSLVEEATKAGANQILGTRFSVDKPEKYREEARDKAISNAREQAQKLASTLGITLGKVTNVVESSTGDFPILFDKAQALSAEGRGGATPELSPGTQTITSVVTLYFEKR